jgi:hypothetical protein
MEVADSVANALSEASGSGDHFAHGLECTMPVSNTTAMVPPNTASLSLVLRERTVAVLLS